MGASSALRELAGFLDDCEREEAVDRVELDGAIEPTGEGAVTAEVELVLAVRSGGCGPGLTARATSLGDDGTLAMDVESTRAVIPTTSAVEVDPTGAAFAADGTVVVTLSIRSGGADAPEAAGAPSADADGGAGRPLDGSGDAAAADGGAVAGRRTADGRRSAGEAAVEEGEVGDGGAADAPGGVADAVRDRDRDVPPFEDSELLAEVYESCDTFAEMTDALGMSVTAETVRRYMIDFGIHEPNSYDTGDGDEEPQDGTQSGDGTSAGDETPTGDRTQTGDGRGAAERPGSDDPTPEPSAVDAAGGDSPVVVTDGVGLPDDVTVEDLIETVRRSNTIYEVTRGLGVDREDALEMLRELDLLSLVVGRLATEADRDLGRDEIIDRIRQATEAKAA